MSITVLLAEDNSIMRAALREFVGRSNGLEVIAEAADGENAVRLANEVHPDVIVMDLGLPVLEGTEAARQILSSCPTSRVVVLSGTADHEAMAKARSAGASAVIPKERAFEDLISAIKSAGTRAG